MTRKYKPIAIVDGMVASTPIAAGCAGCVFSEFDYETGTYRAHKKTCYPFLKKNNINGFHAVFRKMEDVDPVELARMLVLGLERPYVQ